MSKRRSEVVAAALGLTGAAFVMAAVLAGCRQAKEHKTGEPQPSESPAIAIKQPDPSPVKIIYPSAPGSFVELAKRLDPSVVTIKSTSGVTGGPTDMYPGFEGPPSGASSLGSGFIISEDGYILTNNHVIEHATEVRVNLSDGRDFPAKIIGRDEKLDIGLIKIEAAKGSTLTPCTMGDSDKLDIGEWVVAIGNPFGLEHTVTAGIVSAKGRSARDVPMGPMKNYYWNFIQTDASINPGNSGGPLINTSGEVIGINTAIDARGAGIGFAIPINMAKQVLPMLQKTGGIQRAFLGAFIHPVTVDVATRSGLTQQRGALVADVVENAPAARAGLTRGDIVLTFDGKIVDDRTLPFIASTSGIGRTVDVVIWRDKKQMTVKITLEKMPE